MINRSSTMAFTTIPVPFADVGKSANDLLGKDFPVGQTKLELKTVAPNGVVRFFFSCSLLFLWVLLLCLFVRCYAMPPSLLLFGPSVLVAFFPSERKGVIIARGCVV